LLRMLRSGRKGVGPLARLTLPAVRLAGTPPVHEQRRVSSGFEVYRTRNPATPDVGRALAPLDNQVGQGLSADSPFAHRRLAGVADRPARPGSGRRGAVGLARRSSTSATAKLTGFLKQVFVAKWPQPLYRAFLGCAIRGRSPASGAHNRNPPNRAGKTPDPRKSWIPPFPRPRTAPANGSSAVPSRRIGLAWP
jgi:hypothetical protein